MATCVEAHRGRSHRSCHRTCPVFVTRLLSVCAHQELVEEPPACSQMEGGVMTLEGKEMTHSARISAAMRRAAVVLGAVFDGS